MYFVCGGWGVNSKGQEMAKLVLLGGSLGLRATLPFRVHPKAFKPRSSVVSKVNSIQVV